MRILLPVGNILDRPVGTRYFGDYGSIIGKGAYNIDGCSVIDPVPLLLPLLLSLLVPLLLPLLTYCRKR